MVGARKLQIDSLQSGHLRNLRQLPKFSRYRLALVHQGSSLVFTARGQTEGLFLLCTYIGVMEKKMKLLFRVWGLGFEAKSPFL